MTSAPSRCSAMVMRAGSRSCRASCALPASRCRARRRCAACARTAAACARAPGDRARRRRLRRPARPSCCVSVAAWRTMRARRCTWRWNGTMRVRMRPFCNSVIVRACCVQQVLRVLGEVLEQLLDAADVVRRFGERARELLDRGVAVELERIEVAALARLSSSWRCRICASVSISSLRSCSFRRVTVRDSSPRLKSMEPICCSRRARAMLASPELLSSWSSSSASTRAISGRSAGAAGSRPGGTAPGGSSGPSAPRPSARSREAGGHGFLRRSAHDDGQRLGFDAAASGATRPRAPAVRGSWLRTRRRRRRCGFRRRHSRDRRRPRVRRSGVGAAAIGGGAAAPARRRRRKLPARARAAACGAAGAGAGAGSRGRGAGAAGAAAAAARTCPAREFCAMRPRAVGTPLPELTDSRMRASSSSAVCAGSKARSSAATTPLSICMKSVSSSWPGRPSA